MKPLWLGEKPPTLFPAQIYKEVYNIGYLPTPNKVSFRLAFKEISHMLLQATISLMKFL